MRRQYSAPPQRQLTVLPGGGRPSSHLKQAAVYYIILALAAVLMLLAGYHWLGTQLLARRLQIIAASPGIMETTFEMAGVIIREELVIRSPCTGVILELHPDGARISAGTELATMLVISRDELTAILDTGGTGSANIWARAKAALQRWFNRKQDQAPGEEIIVVTGKIPPWFKEKIAVVSDKPGLLSHYLDGWESLNRENHLFPEQFASSGGEPVIPAAGLFVEEGRPLFKVVNNWQWYFNVVMPLDPGRTVAAQKKVIITFSFAPDNPVEGLLEESRIESAAGDVRLSYRLVQQIPGFERARWTEARLSFQRREGVIVPYSALVERENETGVFINSGGTVRFFPVTVIRRQDDRVMVEGIDAFSMVITRPHLVREGQRLD